MTEKSMLTDELRALAERYDDEAVSAARRFLYGTSSGGPSGSTQAILNLFAIAAALRARTNPGGQTHG